jgi:NADPH-dependent curcumin reductase
VPTTMNRRVLLKNRPAGEPQPSDFEIAEAPIPRPDEGEVLCRTIWLSLDPYMRGRMRDVKSYAAPVEIGGVMVGGTVSQVLESRHSDFKAGDFVLGYGGWQTHHVARVTARPGPFGPLKLDPRAAPISTALGVLGMPGMTAYVGLLDIGKPKAGETVVVSAAAGAVGSAVGQLAKIKGARAVGVAGSPDKCAYVVKELGFDACVSYRSPDLAAALKRECPTGIDVYFDNVGGDVLKAVFPQLNAFARVPLCGQISQYSATEMPPGPNLGLAVGNRITIQGFIVSDHAARLGEFLHEAHAWVREGRLKYHEDVAEGLDSAPAAFIGMLRGKNLGKQLVRVTPDPTR